MIPIVSLLSLVNFLISFFISIKLYFSYQKTRNLQIKLFFSSLICLTVFFLMASTPGLIFKHPFLLAWLNIIGNFFGMIGAIFFTLIPLNLLHSDKLKKVYLALMLAITVVANGFRIYYLEPFYRVSMGNFEYWLTETNNFLLYSKLIIGASIFLSLIFSGIIFIIYAFSQKKNRRLFIRSLLFGTGTIILGIAAVINYLIGVFPEIFIFSVILSSLFSIVSLLILFIAIFYKNGQEGTA